MNTKEILEVVKVTLDQVGNPAKTKNEFLEKLEENLNVAFPGEYLPMKKKPSTLKLILMKRDGMSEKEADDAIMEARLRVFEGENPEEILAEEFGLEPDYVFDLIP